jgi:hypothetical protein
MTDPDPPDPGFPLEPPSKKRRYTPLPVDVAARDGRGGPRRVFTYAFIIAVLACISESSDTTSITLARLMRPF